MAALVDGAGVPGHITASTYPAMGLIIANLDCEVEHAGGGSLPGPVRRMISAAGTLLAVLGRPGDRLWTPEPVHPSRVMMNALVPGHAIELVSGPLDAVPAEHAGATAAEVLAWGETPRVARMRAQVAASAHPQAPPDADWCAALWHLWPPALLARRASDRRFCAALGQELGVCLPGTAVLGSVAALQAHLAAGGHELGHQGAWVLKAPLSASGRERLRRRGPALDAPSRTRAERLLARYGELVFEPWVDRVLDLGCIGLVTGASTWDILPPHLLETDAAGVFRGIEIAAAGSDLWPSSLAPVTAVAHRVARELASGGYLGPFGIDGFFYRDAGGAVRLHPMCEINARMSFGLVAHALARRYPGRAVRLRLGMDPVPEGPGVVPLLEPGAGELTCAWLELPDRLPAAGGRAGL